MRCIYYCLQNGESFGPPVFWFPRRLLSVERHNVPRDRIASFCFHICREAHLTLKYYGLDICLRYATMSARSWASLMLKFISLSGMNLSVSVSHLSSESALQMMFALFSASE